MTLLQNRRQHFSLCLRNRFRRYDQTLRLQQLLPPPPLRNLQIFSVLQDLRFLRILQHAMLQYILPQLRLDIQRLVLHLLQIQHLVILELLNRPLLPLQLRHNFLDFVFLLPQLLLYIYCPDRICLLLDLCLGSARVLII